MKNGFFLLHLIKDSLNTCVCVQYARNTEEIQTSCTEDKKLKRNKTEINRLSTTLLHSIEINGFLRGIHSPTIHCCTKNDKLTLCSPPLSLSLSTLHPLLRSREECNATAVEPNYPLLTNECRGKLKTIQF